jgi:decaprenylphospho-beta-D-ribofuranose 2-oxidase
MRHFCRILEFNVADCWIEAEAGIRLGDLNRFLLERGFCLPVLPGFPAITLGGGIALDVHGKNHFRHGTFGDNVLSLLLWHPARGLHCVQSGVPAFDATVGGAGLTGVIVSARVRVVPQPAALAVVSVMPIANLEAAHHSLAEAEGESDLLYTWHNLSGYSQQRSYLIATRFLQTGRNGASPELPGASKIIEGRSWPFFNAVTVRISNALFGGLLSLYPRRDCALEESLFPLTRFSRYFRLFGPCGLLEHQVLVPFDAWSSYVRRLRKIQRESQIPLVNASVKLFRGQRRGIRFGGEGLSFTFDVRNTTASQEFLQRIDKLDCDTGSHAAISKDSRLSAEVFARQQPELARFRELRSVLDPHRSFDSHLAQRLAL